MRRVMWTLACALALCGPAAGVPARAPDLSTTDAVLRWINGYRTKPDIAQVPVAVRTLSQLGALRDSETSAVYVGFVAGIIGYHPQNAGELIENMLPRSKDRQDTDKLPVGSMAKFTLASNAAHDAALLAMLRREAPRQPTDVQPILKEVIESVDTMEIAHLRKAALAAIEDLKRKGPGSKRDLSTWGQVGQGALALGCVAAAATGQVEFGLPCVVGGALGSAALNFWTKD